jgi:hypothetical protein
MDDDDEEEVSGCEEILGEEGGSKSITHLLFISSFLMVFFLTF